MFDEVVRAVFAALAEELRPGNPLRAVWEKTRILRITETGREMVTAGLPDDLPVAPASR